MVRSTMLLAKEFSEFRGKTTDFGYQTVDADMKEDLVRKIFSNVASKYDIMNDLMSAGTHRLWKDELIESMCLTRQEDQPPPRLLDVAGGTGDVAFRMISELSKLYSVSELRSSMTIEKADAAPEVIRSPAPVVVCDINPEMLDVGRKRAPSMLKDKADLVYFYHVYYDAYLNADLSLFR